MVHTIPNQLSTTITDEEPQRMSGVLRVGMFAVVEPTMQSACLIDECGVSILRTGFSHGSTSQRERRPGRLWRVWDLILSALLAGAPSDGMGGVGFATGGVATVPTPPLDT